MKKKSFWLPPELVKEIETLAETLDKTESEIARKAFYKYFPKVKPPTN